MRRIRPFLGIILSILFVAVCLTPQVKTILCLPNSQKVVVGQTSLINIQLPHQLENKIEIKMLRPSQSVFASPQDPPISINHSISGYEITALKPGKVNVEVKILGLIPIKSITIESIPIRRVMPGGHSIGVVLQSQGIMVVGYAPVLGTDGKKSYPAKDQGVELGDVILQADGQEVDSEEDLARNIDEKKGQETVLQIKRKERSIPISVRGIFCSETNRYRIGLYVRDGVVGVGTLSFWDPTTKEYGALGHIILDADTRQGINVRQGKIVTASIQSIKPGVPGHPGEKIGIFGSQGKVQGSISKNTYYGIFGQTVIDVQNPLTNGSVEVAYAHQVKVGKAQMFTVINGEDIQAFDIVIEKLYPVSDNGKGMVVRITDPRLLSLTGGIIQGMSGSPIIQDSKIVGAITHVFLNDPSRGYGIYMDNMLSEMQNPEDQLKKVSTNY
ncbi:MAG TPA: SpoIVB peptidase [Syntrophomonadaceae bacterium]|nr:SpoIVB peptidase [Syntrophomonadaceae bacterium]